MQSINSTLIINISCNQCLCYSKLSYPVLNCFSNNSCQFFPEFPLTYRIKQIIDARLYFPQRIFQNISQGCIPNTDTLLNKLIWSSMTTANISNPSELLIDDYGYISTIDKSLDTFSRFNITNLKLMNSIGIDTSSVMAIAYDNGFYYIKAYTTPLVIINSTSLTIVNNISLTSVNRARGIIFLKNGQIMVVSSYGTNSLVFFNRSNTSPINYIFISNQLINCSGPYGMWRVNDSFFYVTSYNNYSLYSYSDPINGLWKETFLFTVSNINNSNGVPHVTVDNGNRLWISLGTQTIYIYNQQGNILGNYTMPSNSKIADIKILANYVMYFSDVGMNRIIRIDPNISCN
ncbi:hypothetical protein I4U23_020058 [Adineta vaga]|nr:hypothetical protein I4U23_020058 [Adineta vaga]